MDVKTFHQVGFVGPVQVLLLEKKQFVSGEKNYPKHRTVEKEIRYF